MIEFFSSSLGIVGIIASLVISIISILLNKLAAKKYSEINAHKIKAQTEYILATQYENINIKRETNQLLSELLESFARALRSILGNEKIKITTTIFLKDKNESWFLLPNNSTELNFQLNKKSKDNILNETIIKNAYIFADINNKNELKFQSIESKTGFLMFYNLSKKIINNNNILTNDNVQSDKKVIILVIYINSPVSKYKYKKLASETKNIAPNLYDVINNFYISNTIQINFVLKILSDALTLISNYSVTLENKHLVQFTQNIRQISNLCENIHFSQIDKLTVAKFKQNLENIKELYDEATDKPNSEITDFHKKNIYKDFEKIKNMIYNEETI